MLFVIIYYEKYHLVDGRGIPLWLDHIDREIRLTDQLVEALVEQYMDTELQQRLLKMEQT